MLKILIKLADYIVMNKQTKLEWQLLKSSIKESSLKRFKLGFFNLSHQGGGLFFYSYKKKGEVRTGIFTTRLKFISPTLLVFTFVAGMGWLSYFALNRVTNNTNNILVSQNEESDGIGGFTDLSANDGKKITKDDIDVVQLEKDEKKKNDLLGVSSVKTKTSKESTEKSNIEAQKIRYRVRPGDTMGSIANKFHVSVGAIAGSTGLRVIDDISVGQVLYIPSKEGFFYTVKKGDRLGNVLKRYKVSLDQFVSTNVELNPDLLEVGDDIFLPGAKPKNLVRGWFVPVISRIITSGFGYRRYPRKSFHKGLDLKAFYAPIRAARSGVVIYRGWLGGYGKAVVISHSGGYKTLYGHLSRIYVKKGQKIGQGRVIARSGNTGYSTGPHMHFEVTHNGKHINPRKVLKGVYYRVKKKS